MIDKINHNSSCDFTEQIVSYLYDEINVSEKSRLESHLRSCQSCAGEIAGFDSIRSSIQEWRAEDFASLTIPVIELPQTEKRADVSRSPLETIRAYFAFSPKWMPIAAAMSVITLCAGLFWLTAISSGDESIADGSGETIKEAVSSPKETIRNDLTAMNSDNDSEGISKSQQVRTPKAVKNDLAKNILPPVRNNSQAAVNNSQSVKIKKSAAANLDKNADKTALRRLNKKTLPTLLVEDEEDTSLRLSDILEEVSLK